MASKLQFLLKPLLSNFPATYYGTRGFKRWLAPTLKVLKKRKEAMGPEQPIKRSNFAEWNYKAELYAFGKRLNEEFHEGLLQQALTEKSYIQAEEEKQKGVGIEPQLELKDNDDLSEKGGYFINTFSERYIKTVLPRLPSEYIVSIRDDLVQEQSLAHISKYIGIDDIVLSAEFPPSEKTLSNTFKAVTQALLLSSGPDRASAFVRDFVLTQLSGKDITPLCSPKDPLKVLESIIGAPLESRIIAESGKHSILANYQVGIYQNKKFIARGCGENLEIAEEMAALEGLWKIWGVSFNRRPFLFDLELPPDSVKFN